jgi:hypothetical protein
MVFRMSVCLGLLTISGAALTSNPGQTEDWKRLATLYHARRVQDVKVLSARDLEIEGVHCRLLGIRLRPGEGAQRDAKRFLERFLWFNDRVVRIANAHDPAEGKDHVPLIWLEGGYGAMAQVGLVRAGLATLDEGDAAELKFYRDDARRFEFRWKRALQIAEADFKAGKNTTFGFPWPSPVPTDDAVCAAVRSRLGKPDYVYTIAGHTYLDYRFDNGRTLTLVVYRGDVADSCQDGGWRSFPELRSAIETRLGKPQGVITSGERVMLDYNLDDGRTLSLVVCDGSVVGASYGRTEDLRSLVGLRLTVEGKVSAVGKPGSCVMTHRGEIYFRGKRRDDLVDAWDEKPVKISGVLKYDPPYPGPLPWPPAQVPYGGLFHFDADAGLRIEPVGER